MIRFVTWTLTILFMLVLAGAISVLVILFYFGRGLPDYAQLAKYEPPVVSRIYAGDGRLFAEYATQKRVFVPIEAIPRQVIQTFLAAEDKNFYEHSGLDFMGIMRAAIFNFTQRGQNKRPKGASTITQQVAKNLLLSSIATKASYDRKIKEAILSFRIENALSKDRILELYLNEIFLGAGSYGIAAAALNYFNKSLDELSIAEAAFLAGLPKAPSKYNPKNNYESSKSRRDWVITRMFEERIITREEALAAKAEPIRLQKPDPTHVVKADYFAEEVRRRLISKYGEASLYQGGLTVRTTLNPHIQKIADWALRKGIIAYDRRHGWRGPLQHIELKNTNKETWKSALDALPSPPGIGYWQVAIVIKLTNKDAHVGLKSGEEGIIPLSEIKWARSYIRPKKKASYNASTYVPDFALGPLIHHPEDVLTVGDVVLIGNIKDKKNIYSLQQYPMVSGALMVMDPHTGRILAMTGGFSFEASQFNRATQALRQPGSAIKPFVYLTAMERGFSPATVVSDAPIYINMGRGLGTYAPKNVINRHYGPQPLSIGLQKSLNRMTIRLVHEYVGMKPVAKLIEKFGIMDRVPMQIAMAIGAGETTLERLTTAYAMLANGGKKLEATLIDRIQDRHGKTLFTADKRICSNCHTESWENQNLPTIEDQREQLADPRSIYQITSMLEGAVKNGSARRAQALERIIAVKTGTTNDERDAWAAGYTPDFVFVTYVGYDHPETLTRGEGGARVAVPILVDCAAKVLQNIPNKAFSIPAEMKLVRTGSTLEAFKKNQSTPRKASAKTPQYSNPSSDSYPSPSYYRQYGRPAYPANNPYGNNGGQKYSPYDSYPPRPQPVPYHSSTMPSGQQKPSYNSGMQPRQQPMPYNPQVPSRPQGTFNAPMPARPPQYASPYNAPVSPRPQAPAPYNPPVQRSSQGYGAPLQTPHTASPYGAGTGGVY